MTGEKPSTTERGPSLRRIRPHEIESRLEADTDAETRAVALAILDDVRARGTDAVVAHATRFGDLDVGAPLLRTREDCDAAREGLDADTRGLLERTAERIRSFALAQKQSLSEISVAVDGGQAGQSIAPLGSAGCYAPGGRFPLCSSLLMTAVTARAAGVERVLVATPRPTDVMLACAAIADADAVLAVGGAQAIGALVYGCTELDPVDIVVGPGNRFVTAAKELVSGRVKIDMLAGPTELVVLADHTSDAGVIAADLLAQAEHDVDARPILVTTSSELVDAVELELARQLEDLPTRATAAIAIERNGLAVLAADRDEAIAVTDRISPEHLQVVTERAADDAARLRHYGAIFIGEASAEVFGDYGVGPNHVLPTATSARYRGGLSILDFLRVTTWMKLDGDADLGAVIEDAARLARLEGLEGHARAAERRRPHP